MPIDSVSSASGSQANWQQIRNDFQTLSQSLQTGNVAAAQKAYTSIQQDQQNSPQPSPDSPAAQAFAQLGQALQSGDIAGAQQAFSSFQSAVKGARPAHGGKGSHGGGGSDAADGTDSSDAAQTVESETTVQNADGSSTVTTTYSDGSTSTQTQPKPVVSPSPLAANSQQLTTLLNAQEQASAVE